MEDASHEKLYRDSVISEKQSESLPNYFLGVLSKKKGFLSRRRTFQKT